VTSGSLDQPIAKLKRAAEHYRTIKYKFFGGLDTQLRTGTLERKRDGLEYRVRAGEIEPIPAGLSLIFGDAYFNLRAALDYLVYQMHVRHYRGRLPVPGPGQPDIARQSAFPIRDRRPSSPTSAWLNIENLAVRERTAIEWLQPYQTRGSALVKDLREALLYINLLNNIDKHRELHLAQIMAMWVQVPRFASEFGFRQHPAFGVALESGAYVDTWTFLKPPPPEQMDMEPVFSTAVAIEPGGSRTEAVADLGGLILAVDLVIKRFSHLFPPPSEPLDLSWVRRRERL
jgi:hypothetical protein